MSTSTIPPLGLSPQYSALITAIHASPTMAVIVVTGGGAQAIADLLAVPGASKTVLEVLVPYSERSLTEFLGAPPTQAVSVDTAAAMAQAAYQRALRLREEATTPVIGLSCTATLATDRPKKGDHRAHLGLCNREKTQVYSLTLTKGARDRQGEERIISSLLLNILAEACDLEAHDDLGLHPEEQLHVTVVP
jgi:nicotinamide mononucleotide (NMN) deamidase PncC